MTESIKKEIKEIQKEIEETPYNKSTEEHIGRLKAKLSNLKEKLEKRKSSSGGKGYSIPKSGDRTIVLVGYPSVGKSTLLSKLTNAESETASYDFTTLKVVPGMLKHNGANIQVLDVPGLIKGASSGKGSGKKVLSVVRNADLVLKVVDVDSIEKLEELNQELYEAGIRLDQTPPKIKIEKKDSGGLSITSSVNQEVDEKTIKTILREYKISNARINLREKITVDDLVDKIAGNKAYIPSLTVVNKIDKTDKNIEEIKIENTPDKIFVSAKEEKNLNYLKQRIFKKLNLMSIFLKPKNGEVDKDSPLIIDKKATIEDVCKEIHSDFEERFQFARIWGESAKFDGQQVGLDHKLENKDIVQLVMKNI